MSEHWTDRIDRATASRCARDPEATPDTTPEDIAIALMGGIDTVGLHRDDVIERIADAVSHAESEAIRQRDELRAMLRDARPWVELCRIPENDIRAMALLEAKLKLIERIDRLLGRDRAPVPPEGA